MAGEFKQWDPNLIALMSDASYLIDTKRLNGAAAGIMPKEVFNKALLQACNFVAALADSMITKGFTVEDGSDAGFTYNDLKAVLAQIETKKDIVTYPFAAGTRMLFQQAAAPTGWTKETNAAYTDVALRVVTAAGGGTGGVTAFTNVFNTVQAVVLSMGAVAVTVNGHVLTIGELAIHSHLITDQVFEQPFQVGVQGHNKGTSYGAASGSAGSNQAHDHTASGSVTGSGSFTRPDIKYADVIVAQKDV